MAKFDVNKKTNVIETVKKYVQSRPVIIPNDKYEAYAIELKKTRDNLRTHKIINYIFGISLTITLTLLITR